MAEGPYRGMKCGNCRRVFEIPVPRRPPHKCPVCEHTLCLTVDKPTIDNWNAFLLWEDTRKAKLEGMLNAPEAA